MKVVATLCTALLAFSTMLPAAEEQSHGVLFEQWVRDTFFAGYKPKSYTQTWDIPAEVNTKHGGVPANPKAVKWGSPVDLGDALRQFRIAERGERFLLIVGFWEQEEDTKRWVHCVAAEVTPEQYRALWSPITKEDLEKLDALVKDKSLPLDEARAQVQAMKRRVPFSKAIMQVNPKMDASQRRLQCSVRFGDFFHFLAPTQEVTRQEKPKLWSVPLPDAFVSPPRK
jgi:hypothetical protein